MSRRHFFTLEAAAGGSTIVIPFPWIQVPEGGTRKWSAATSWGKMFRGVDAEGSAWVGLGWWGGSSGTGPTIRR